ncbi:Multicilin, partial [Manacus vitellinus]
WRDQADQHQKALGDAMEANSQLQETLIQRQEELATLRERNVQLKELASQARQLASVLDVSATLSSGLGAPVVPVGQCGVRVQWGTGCGTGTRRADAEGVDAMLRAVSEKCRAALRSLGGSPG